MSDNPKQLKAELAVLRRQVEQKFSDIEARIDTLIEQEEQLPSRPETVISSRVEPVSPQVKLNNLQPKVTEPSESIKREQPSPPAEKADSFIKVIFLQLVTALLSWTTPVARIYNSYKERNMAGIFVLTVIGIGLTLAGFGYLMQLLIDELGAGTKSLLMLLTSFAVIGLGGWIKLKTRFTEYAAAIVSLGILLSYCTVYFAGSIYQILPYSMALIFYLAISMLSHVLAIWLDTKVIASLGIIGISVMPLLSGTTEQTNTSYLLSLAFVVSSSLVIALRYTWPWLANTSLVFVFIALEWMLSYNTALASAWLINIFYLLFFSYWLASILKSTTEITRSLIFLAAVVGTTLASLVQATDVFSHSISLLFAVNGSIAAAASYYAHLVNRNIRSYLILITAMWYAIAILSYISSGYWGIAWSIEGILLLFIARRQLLPLVAIQGHFLLAVAVVYCIYAIALYFPLPALVTIDGWVLILSTSLIIGTWQRMINNSRAFNQFTLNSLLPALQLLETVWISVILMFVSHIWLQQWTGSLAILLQLALLYRAKQCQCTSIEVLAALLILTPIYYVTLGAIEVNSFRFTNLPLYAQVSAISAFVQLWLWSEFYRRYQPNSQLVALAERARLLFYILLPVCWLSSAIRRLETDSLVLLWLSPIIALSLAKWVKHQILYTEAKILSVIASAALIAYADQLSPLFNFVSVIGFSSLYLAAYLYNRHQHSHYYEFIITTGIVTLGFALPMLSYNVTESYITALAIAALYWGGLQSQIANYQHLGRNQNLIVVINLSVVCFSWLATLLTPSSAIVTIIYLALGYYSRDSFMNNSLVKKWNINQSIFFNSVAALGYTTLLSSFATNGSDLLIAPCFTLHGIIMLLLHKEQLKVIKYSFLLMLLGITKLALIDSANALLWQKVMLFIGIGVFILIASFWYQKHATHSSELEQHSN